MGVKWVDANKGDEENPEYRCRLVAKEIKKDNREGLFAATPPLEAKKMLFSLWASAPRIRLGFGSVVRAYFHARARGRVCVELAREDFEEATCGYSGDVRRKGRCVRRQGRCADVEDGVHGDDGGGWVQARVAQRAQSTARRGRTICCARR